MYYSVWFLIMKHRYGLIEGADLNWRLCFLDCIVDTISVNFIKHTRQLQFFPEIVDEFF